MSAAQYLIGLDLGTSGVKAVMIERGGRELASASRSYRVETPQPGWAETDPAVWVSAALDVLAEVVRESGAAPGQIAGLGLAGQMHSLVCMDGRGQSLRPAILWADTRSAAQVEGVKRRIGQVDLVRLTGNPLAAGFMLPSWLWLRQHEPETVRRTAWLLLPKDYLRFVLTGQTGSEPSDASSTLLFDPFQRIWSRELLERLEIDPALLPEVAESAAVAAGLRDDIAATVGLLPGTPVVYGASDQAAQAVGHGVLEEGLVSCTIGSGGQLLAPLHTPAADPELRLHMFCHAAPDLWHLEAATLTAGLSLQWLRDATGGDYGSLADAAQQVPPGAEGLLFAPYLAGERTPHMDPALRGGFIGLGLHHGRAHLARAVMEGVVFSLRLGLDLMRTLGVKMDRLVASGGSVRHPLWLQLQADIFGAPVYRTAAREAAASGAALLAGIGTGLYADLASACRQTAAPQPDPVLPDSAHSAAYEEIYPRYLRMADAIRTVVGEDSQHQ